MKRAKNRCLVIETVPATDGSALLLAPQFVVTAIR
jgi:hypothetical protein